MQKRDFKLSSVLIIQVIMSLIIYLLGTLFDISPTSGSENEPSMIYSILAMAVSIFTNIILAHGLLFNRMGTVSEYLEGIHVINLKKIGLSALVNAIPTFAMIFIGSLLSVSLTASLLAGGINGLGSIMISLILLLIVYIIYFIFTAYQYFVVVDNPNMSFGTLFKQIFLVGKDLALATVKVFLKWILVPVIVYLVLLIAMLKSASGPNMGATIFASILSLAFIIYIIIAFALFLNQLSLNYLDYKAKNNERSYQELVLE